MTIDALIEKVVAGGREAEHAERALIGTGAAALPRLAAATESLPPFEARVLVDLIARLPDPAMAPFLMAYAADPDGARNLLRREIPEIVGKLGGPGVREFLLARLQTRRGWRTAARALGYLGEPQTAPALLAKLTDLLGSHDDDASVEAAIARLMAIDDDVAGFDIQCAVDIAGSLAMLGNFERVSILPAVFRAHGMTQEVRLQCLQNMELAVGATTLTRVRDFLGEPDDEVRSQLLRVLDHIGTRGAVEAICELTRDRDEELAEHAHVRLEELTGSRDPETARDLVAGCDETVRLRAGQPIDYRAWALSLRDKFGWLHLLSDFEVHTATMFGPRRNFRAESKDEFQRAVDEWVERESDKFEIGGHYRWGHRVAAPAPEVTPGPTDAT